MKKTVYHKLVRDRIPAIIEAEGKTCVTEILSDQEYRQKLNDKLQEEVTEYRIDGSLRELADVLEVIHAIVAARGFSWEYLEAERIRKSVERGGFNNKIFLKEVTEEESK